MPGDSGHPAGLISRRQVLQASSALAGSSLLGGCGSGTPDENGFKPGINSLAEHATPQWFRDAKFGVFIHWGLYSIPAFAPHRSDVPDNIELGSRDQFKYNAYAEWYQNSLLFEDGPTAEYHRQHYGDAPYAQFANDFNDMLESWDPQAWARDIARSGARYLVLVTKHHDGFTLWPSAVRNPHVEGWSTRRDVVGELAEAVRAQGMRFGVYYSGGIDWSFRHRRIESMAGLILTMPGPFSGYLDYANAHYRELIERYRPDYLWNDISYPSESAALDLAAHYYNSVEHGLINDRWIAPRGLLRPSAWHRPDGITGILPPEPPVWDVRTPEYTMFDRILPFEWETTRGVGHSFGYNRQETREDLIDPADCINMLTQAACCNGNVLLNIGPRGDGTLDPAQLQCLHAVGHWLNNNGDSLQDTRPLAMPQTELAGIQVGATTNQHAAYVHLLGTPPPGRHQIELPFLPSIEAANLRGDTGDNSSIELNEQRLTIKVQHWPETPTQVIDLHFVPDHA